MSKTLKQKVQAIADKVGGTMYEGYSGRGMYGQTCFGVVCKGYDVQEVKQAGARRKLGSASTDNMACDMIVYWPDAVEPAPRSSKPDRLPNPECATPATRIVPFEPIAPSEEEVMREMAPVMTVTASQSCYPDEIETLREMLDDVRAGLAERVKLPEWRKRTASVQNAIALRERRIEALRTAIEALAGAL